MGSASCCLTHPLYKKGGLFFFALPDGLFGFASASFASLSASQATLSPHLMRSLLHGLFSLGLLSVAPLVTADLSAARAGAPLSTYDRNIVAAVLVLEAASDGPSGMHAVLNVIHNRADGRLHRMSGEVATYGAFCSMRPIWRQRQPDFSPLLRRAQRDRHFDDAVKLVIALERGILPDITGGATFYHHYRVNPEWNRDMTATETVGSHIFYRPGRDNLGREVALNSSDR